MNTLTPQQKQDYDEHGYVQLANLLDDATLAMLTDEFDYMVTEQRKAVLDHGESVDATWQGARNVAGPQATVLIDRHDLQAFSAPFARFLHDARLVDCYADLLGTQNIQLHHSKMFQKPPENGSAFPAHQDQPFFPHEHDNVLAAIIHLTDADDTMGCVKVYPDSHKLGPLPRLAGENHLDPEQWPIDAGVDCPASRGDVLFFNYLTVHASGVNTSPRTRKTILIQVRDAASAPLCGGISKPNHASGLMLRGRSPRVRPGRATWY